VRAEYDEEAARTLALPVPVFPEEDRQVIAGRLLRRAALAMGGGDVLVEVTTTASAGFSPVTVIACDYWELPAGGALVLYRDGQVVAAWNASAWEQLRRAR
jgi:hypothetical protein